MSLTIINCGCNIRLIMAGSRENLFKIPDLTLADRKPETVNAEKAHSIARIFQAVGYVAAIESATASISEKDWVIREVVVGQLTANWLKDGGDDLLTSAGYQVFDDGFVVRTLSNYEWPPETPMTHTPRSLLENPLMANINDNQAHPRITFEELRDRTQEAMASLAHPPQDSNEV